jgi:putative heme-binding domain-containing protein
MNRPYFSFALILALAPWLANTAGAAPPTQEEYRSYAETHPGDAAGGKKVFHDHKMSCLNCHGQPGEGGADGPDLVDVGLKHDRAYLVRAILEPSADLAPGFAAFRALTDTGKELRGTFVAETATAITYRDSEDKEQTVAKDRLESWHVFSEMPDKLYERMTLQEFADVVAYLESLKGVASAE